MLPRRWSAWSLLLGPALSAVIELTQKTLLDARYATVSDFIANSLGATLGVLVALTIRAMVAVRDEQVIARYRATPEVGVGGR